MLHTNDLTQSMNVCAKLILNSILSTALWNYFHQNQISLAISRCGYSMIPNQLTGVSSCGVERGEARFELNLIPELRSKSQIFTGLSLSG